MIPEKHFMKGLMLLQDVSDFFPKPIRVVASCGQYRSKRNVKNLPAVILIQVGVFQFVVFEVARRQHQVYPRR